jgi:hypothetical protein
MIHEILVAQFASKTFWVVNTWKNDENTKVAVKYQKMYVDDENRERRLVAYFTQIILKCSVQYISIRFT